MNPAVAKSLIGVRRLLATCSIAIALAALINAAFGTKALLAVVLDGQPIATQIGWGITFGLAISIASLVNVLFFPPFSSLRRQLLELLSRLDLSALNPLWFGLAAGIGEELLFRGALQPIVGVCWSPRRNLPFGLYLLFSLCLRLSRCSQSLRRFRGFHLARSYVRRRTFSLRPLQRFLSSSRSCNF